MSDLSPTKTAADAQTSLLLNSSPNTGDKTNNTGAIVGGVIGGIAAISLMGCLIWFFLVRQKRKPLHPESTSFIEYKYPTELNAPKHPSELSGAAAQPRAELAT